MSTSTALSTFTFHGDPIECIPDGDLLWVGVTTVCGGIGIDDKNQREKLSAKSWAITQSVRTTAADGREREVFCIDLDSLPMWLATIDERRVPDAIRPKLVRYQRECKKALADFFFKREDPRDAIIADLRRQLAQRPATALRPTDLAAAWAAAHLEPSKEALPLREVWGRYLAWTQAQGMPLPANMSVLSGGMAAHFHRARGVAAAYFCAFRAAPLPVDVMAMQAPRQSAPSLPGLPGPDMLTMKVAELCGKVEMLLQHRARKHARRASAAPKGLAEIMSAIREPVAEFMQMRTGETTTSDIIEALGMQPSRAVEMAIGAVLHDLGYQRWRSAMKRGWKRPYVYGKTEAN